MRLAQDTRRRQGGIAVDAASPAADQAIAATRLAAASDAKAAKTSLADADLTAINTQLKGQIDTINQRLSNLETQIP